MISRRDFIGGLAAAAVLLPLRRAFGNPSAERTLRLYNIHTDESLDIAYFSEGSYDYEALEKINHIMRCHYTNEVRMIDVRLLDLLSDIATRVGRGKSIEIISGYRSFEYNEYLRTRSRKVARDSYHLQGLAADVAISGIEKRTLSAVAKSLYAGGVGRYQKFVHVDVGPVRYW